MSKSLEEELGAFLPENASFLPDSPTWLLETSQGSIPLSRTTSLRKESSPKCLLVGRQASSADIRIQHGSISRRHAIFYIVNQNLFLVDLGGKHGTLVNGKRLEGTTRLQQGDVVYFGTVSTNSFVVKMTDVSSNSNGTVAGNKFVVTEEETTVAPHNEERKEASVSVALPLFQKQQQQQDESENILTGRAKREAEIAAMTASLDETPTYEKYVPTTQQQHKLPRQNLPLLIRYPHRNALIFFMMVTRNESLHPWQSIQQDRDLHAVEPIPT